MAKSINVLLAIKDQFTSPLQKAQGNTKKLDRELKKASNRVKAFGESMKKGMAKAAKATAVGFAAVTAAAGVFAKQSIDAAKVQIEQETKLAAVLKNTKGMTDAHIKSIKEYAGELQNVGVIGDEVAIAGVQQLGSYQLQASTLKKLMPGMNNLLAQTKGLNATTGDAVNIGNMLGKVMTGQVGALNRAGITFTKVQERILKYGTEQQKAATLAKVLESNVGGVNAALAETDQGKIHQANMAYGDMQEEVGKKLLPALAKVARWFFVRIPQIQDFILTTMDKVIFAMSKIKPYLIKVSEIAGQLWDKAKPAVMQFVDILGIAIDRAIGVVQFLIKNWEDIAPVVKIATGAIIAYNTALAIRTTKEAILLAALKLKTSWEAFGASKLTLLTAAQWAYNVALNANPIGLVITAIATLVGTLYMLYKHFDKVKMGTTKLWDKLKGFWKALDNNPFGKVVKFLIKWFTPIGLLINIFIKLTRIIMSNMDTIKATINKVIEFCVALFNNFKKAIIELWEKFTNTPFANFIKSVWDFLDPINTLKEMFKWVGESLLDLIDILDNTFENALNSILHPIDTVKNAIGGLVDKLKFWNKTKVEDKNFNVNRTQNTSTTNTVTTVPRHALGTSYFKGGITGINEGGRGETAVLPSGTQIISHEQGKKAAGTTKIEVNVNVQGNVIGNKEFMESTGQYIANKIKLSLSNI